MTVKSGISENFSENATPKRGRPPIFNGVGRNESMRLLFSDCISEHTERTFQNKLYLQHAIEVLGVLNSDTFYESGNPYKWLVGEGDGMRGKKITLLTELGRLHCITKDDTDLKDLALWLCEKKPNTQKMVRILREIRLAKVGS